MSEAHTHNHDHKYTKEVSNRPARAIGHLQKVKQMADSGKNCSEILIQLAAVKSAIHDTGKLIRKNHLEHCIVHAVQDGNEEMLNELNNAIDRSIK